MATPVDSILDGHLMMADTYNSIREFKSEMPFGHDIVEEVGSIIQRHSLEKHIGILYAHRHFDMPPDSIAMMKSPSDGINITTMTPIDAVDPNDAHGVSFKLMTTGKFQAFEYSARSPTPTFPPAFLEELAQFITKHHLADVLGFSIRSADDDDELSTCELNLFEPKLSVTLPTDDISAELRQNATPTYWVHRSHGSWQGLSQCINYCPPKQCYMCGPRSCTIMCRGQGSDAQLRTIIDEAFSKRGLSF
jgi:hypothetical protein